MPNNDQDSINSKKPPDLIAEGHAAIKSSIEKLNNMMFLPNADIALLTVQMNALGVAETNLCTCTLCEDLDSRMNQAAILSLNNASQDLSAAAARIGRVETVLDDVTRVINSAATLAAAVAPFLV